MKRLLLYIVFLSFPVFAYSQYAKTDNPKKTGGGPLASTSYNDHKRGATRALQYRPDGEDFVCVNGKNRYTRALYGSHTPFRVETSDRPVFAVYDKSQSKNISFRLYLKDRSYVALDSTAWCETRYTAGRRTYRLANPSWGNGAELHISVLAMPGEDAAIWKITPVRMPEGSFLRCYLSEIRLQKLSRNGDMGADPPGCFDASENPKQLETLDIPFSTYNSSLEAERKNVSSCQELKKSQVGFEAEGAVYVLVRDYSLHNSTLIKSDAISLYNKAEHARQVLASRIKITTPDPYFNTLGGALAVAADGIWDGEVWLHGAVGWRMPLNGWRAAYTGDALGWHDRARTHFDAYAASQVTSVPNTIPHPAQDSALALARSEKRWGTPQYSNGYICRNPRRNNQMHHYDMNLCYIDELLWHLNWTGDLDYARRMWPVLTLHLAWEKRNFDPDNDGLYDAYACIWASDALYYNSGAVTHSSAYNYRANRLAAMIASKIGENPVPYQQEADKILKALNTRLWIPAKGHWAEFQDFMGHRRLHESAAVWTIYHALDSDIADPFQAYQATRYVDTEIPHIPILTSAHSATAGADANWQKSLDEAGAAINAEGYATLATTNWLPYSWSINNVAFAEVMHTALAYFQAGRADAGFKLLKSSVLDGMYLGDSPGNFGQISFYDAARGECYRDFGDPIGVASRVLIQGLYGILPDAMNGRLLIRPGLPVAWDYASLSTPDITFDYQRSGKEETYTLLHRLPAVHTLELQFPARYTEVARITANGQLLDWTLMENSIGRPILSVILPASLDEQMTIRIEWNGDTLMTDVSELPVTATSSFPSKHISAEASTRFVEMIQGEMKWWCPVDMPKVEGSANPAESTGQSTSIHEDASAQKIVSARGNAFSNVVIRKCEPVVMTDYFNSSVTDIFRNEYLSPRSPYTTLQIPKQGIGEWCHPLTSADIDDSGVRASSVKGILSTKLGVPFRTPVEGRNIAFTSLWDNYPDRIAIPLKGKASHAYLLLAGTTNHMQCHIANGMIRVYYTDGTSDTLELVNPDNWCPIEQDYYVDNVAFKLSVPRPYRLHLKSGLVSNDLEKDLGIIGVYGRSIDGGAGVLLDMPLNPKKKLARLTLETLSNDVVIGLMGITLQR